MPCFPRKIMLIVLIKLWECTRNLLPTLQKSCCQLYRKHVVNFSENKFAESMWPTSIWKYVANPHWKSALWWSPPPPADFPEGPHLDPTSGKSDKNDNLLFNLFPAFTIGPFDVGQTSLSVRCHQSPMLSVPEVFSRLSTGFCLRHFHFFFWPLVFLYLGISCWDGGFVSYLYFL